MKKYVSPKVNINEMNLKVYSQEEIYELAHFSGTIEELNERYPLECVRKEYTVTSGVKYRIIYLGEKHLVRFWYFPSTGEINAWGYTIVCEKSNFSGLKVGDPIEKVREIDKDGSYAFLYAGRSDFPKTSQHYTKDGYLITIDYDKDYKITKINEELI